MHHIIDKIKWTLIISFCISYISSAHAIKLEINDSYNGTIRDNGGTSIVLPPGNWELLAKNKKTYKFYNPNYGYAFFAYYVSSGADIWRGRTPPTICDNNNYIESNVKTTHIDTFEWCVSKEDNFYIFKNHTAFQFNQHFATYYFDIDLFKGYSKGELKSTGAKIYGQVKKNKRGNLNFLSSIFNRSNESPLPTSNNNSNKKSTTSNETVIKNKLKELKSMLDEGLINQEQYDAKSEELLNDF